jgi:uncharacterized membrane protein
MKTASLRRVLVAALAFALQTAALAGGPIYVYDYVNRVPYAWNMSSWPNGLVPIYTDLGPLGRLSNAQANELVVNAAWQWSSVGTSSFRGVVAGDFAALGLGDVSSENGASIIGTYNGGGIHVIYDNDGSVLEDYFGVPPTSVLGITDIEAVAVDSPEILEAWMVLSGPGIRANDPDGLGFAGVVTHEMGHALNLAHTQSNGATMLSTFLDPPQPQGCGAPWTGETDDTQAETMYPYITPQPFGTGEYMATVDLLDDKAALSDLYPGPGWPANRGTIRGQILDSSGNPVMGINVIARNVADPFHDVTSYISGQVTKGNAGPDGSFVINGLTPGASYLLYTDQLMNGAFSVPRPLVLPAPEEYFNGPLESGNGATDDRCAWTSITATPGSPVTADVTFNHLPGAPTFLTPPDITVQSIPMDITADGSVVVGGAGLGGGPIFRWDVNENTFDIIGGNLAAQCAISDDGLKIAANVVDTDGINKSAIYANNAWTILPPVPGAVPCNNGGDGLSYTQTYDISGDGSTVVGLSYGSQGCGGGTIRGFKWTAAGGTVALPKVDAPTRSSRANTVNYDGSVIAGWDDANSGLRLGVQWRNGVASLIRRNNQSVGEATDVSTNGQYIVGQSSTSGSNGNFWLWSLASGVQLLGTILGQDSGVSGAVNDDGSVITGQSLDFEAGTITPTIWTPGLGITNFNQFLSSQGVVTTGLGMRLGMSMSASGRTITGYANGPYGYVGWVLKIPTALVCHSSETMAVAFPQGLDEHLGHGDTLGACPCVDVDGDGYSTCGGDCNDANVAVHFGASDANCNGVDDDCDGIVDDDAVASPSLLITSLAGDTLVSWDAVAAATGYDVFAGDLLELRAEAGDYASLSTAACLGNDLAATSVSTGGGLPAPGGGYFFLVRAVGCAGAGTYDDTGSGQSGSRDAGIQASPEACP